MKLKDLEKAIELKKEYLKYKSEVDEIDKNINALKKSGVKGSSVNFQVHYFGDSSSLSGKNRQIECYIQKDLILKQLNNNLYIASNLMKKYKLEIEKL